MKGIQEMLFTNKQIRVKIFIAGIEISVSLMKKNCGS